MNKQVKESHIKIIEYITRSIILVSVLLIYLEVIKGIAATVLGGGIIVWTIVTALWIYKKKMEIRNK